MRVLLDVCGGPVQLLPNTELLFISPAYSLVLVVDLTPSMLQVVRLHQEACRQQWSLLFLSVEQPDVSSQVG